MSSKYKKVFDAIKDKIQAGTWFEGMLMPTEYELCELFEVSRITIRRALSELEEEGLVERIQGKGSFVKSKRYHSTNRPGFKDSMAQQGIDIVSKILLSNLVVPPLDIKEKLKSEDLVWHFTRLRSVGDTPVALMESYIPKKIGDEFQSYNLENISFYQLIQTITGKQIIDTTGTVTAIIPTEEQCNLLKVPYGTPHIWYRSVGYLEDGMVAEVSSSIFNANIYEFAVQYENLQSKK
jgi:DNA-binding GntR family transcriptional regulator